MDIKITRLETCSYADDRSEIVAKFDARVGDFNLRRAMIRRRYDGGYFIGTGGGNGRPGFTLPTSTETRRALETAALEAYHGS